MFHNCEFLLQDRVYVPELKKTLLNISMLDGLGFFPRIEYEMMEISRNAKITAKGTKMCDLYILYGSTIIFHASLVSQDSYCETKLRIKDYVMLVKGFLFSWLNKIF